jgi:CBS domain-containing protein
MKAEGVMTRAVVTIAPDATVREAIEQMVFYRISGVPVDANALTGTRR